MDKVVGHSENKQRFERALRRHRLPSTFLFVGPEGIGKRTFAIELAKCLLCETTAPDELTCCGRCEACRLIDHGNHPDFEVIAKLDNKSELVVEQFIGDREHRNREGLCYNLSLKPNRGNRKIAIIDDADLLRTESANSLLKTLEEPPPNSVLIMIASSAERVLPTIRSRSQIFHFHCLEIAEIRQILEGMQAQEFPVSIDGVASSCAGSLAGLAFYHEEGMPEFCQVFFETLSSLEPMSNDLPRQLAGFVDQAGTDNARRRDRLRLLADYAVEFYRNIVAMLCGGNVDIRPSWRAFIDQACKRWKAGPEAALDCVERCLDARTQIDANANLKTLVEAWLSDLGKLSRGEDSSATRSPLLPF